MLFRRQRTPGLVFFACETLIWKTYTLLRCCSYGVTVLGAMHTIARACRTVHLTVGYQASKQTLGW